MQWYIVTVIQFVMYYIHACMEPCSIFRAGDQSTVKTSLIHHAPLGLVSFMVD